MSDLELQYRSNAAVADLQVGECTIRRAFKGGDMQEPSGWRFLTLEASGGAISAWVNPGGDFIENGPCGRTWGLRKTAPGRWEISPSIDCGPDWHHTPALVGVPDGEPWQP